MSIYIFRGKSAAGKSTLTNLLSAETGIPVLRKDDIFDALAKYEINTKVLNGASYDILARQVQTCVDNKADVIVDIALPHTPSLNEFLGKINFKNSTVCRFFCDCSDDSIWLDRWRERLRDPLPNQLFKNIDEIINYYGRCEIEPLDGEIVLDSVIPVDDLLDIIMKAIQ